MSFRKNLFGFLPTWIIAIAAFVMLALSANGFTSENISNILRGAFAHMCLLTGLALTIRSKGPDFSLILSMLLSGYVMGYIYQAGSSLAVSIGAGALTGIACGAVTGVLTVYAKLHVVIVSAILGFGVKAGVTAVLAKKPPLPIAAMKTSNFALLCVLICAAVLVIAVLLCTLSKKLRAPISGRIKKDKSFMLFAAFPIAGGFAALAGAIMVLRLRMVVPQIVTLNTVIFFLLAAMALMSTKALDKGCFGVLYAAVLSFVYYTFVNGLVLNSINSYVQNVILISILAVSFAVMIISNIGVHPKPWFRR